MQVRVIVNSARSLKNVNWQYGTLHPYAVVWIDSSAKCSTKIDLNNNMNPVWNEKFTIPLPPTSFAETAILYIDIVHANAAPGTKPLVGSVRFPLCEAIKEARGNGNVSRCLDLLRPSGRSQGTVEIMIGVKNPDVGQIYQFNEQTPYKQHAASQPPPQAQMQPPAQFQPRSQIQPQGQYNPKPQIQPRLVIQSQVLNSPQQQVQPQSCPQPHPQLQPQVKPINGYPNKPALVRPVVYTPNSQGLVRPTPVQGPRYSTPAATNRPAYRPAKPVPVQQQKHPASGMGTGPEITRMNRDMFVPQNQNMQLANNSNSNASAAPVASGVNDKEEIQYASASGGLPPPEMYTEDPYAKPYQQWQQPYNHMVKPSSDPSQSPPYRSPPPPPHVQISSGGSDSSSNYSGGEALPSPSPSPNMAFGSSQGTFTYEELVIATDGFSDANLLGQGGFGYVHKGVLPNGKEIAVKQLKSGSGQGEREFQAEVEIISRVHHRNLVSLVGYCISGGKRLLVYEMVPNNTLEFHLHGKGYRTMEWSTRLKIALGAAKGLAYLHEDCHPKIIHRDIKAANILLDYKFEAKVADFGLAKFIEDNNTHVSTRVMGTFGYLAPEYASSGKLTEKSDVFSFGVMLLELISGHRPVDRTQSFMNDSLVDWARPLLVCALEDGNYEPLVDPKLQKNYNANEMARMIAVAAACVRYSANRRPRMSKVVRALEGDSSQEDLNEGVKPGHSWYIGSYTSSDYDSSSYSEDMKKFRKMALQSSEYQSSQYSVPTGEYNLNPSGSSSEGQHTREMEIMRKMKNKDSSQFNNEGF